MFCQQCGEKLDAPSVASAGLPGRSRGLALRAIRLVVLVGLVALLVLLLWPVNWKGAEGSQQDTVNCYRKLVRLDHALQKSQPAEVLFLEREVNGYLAAVIAQTEREAVGDEARLTVKDINLLFTPESFVALIRADWGPVLLSDELKGRPVAGSRPVDVEFTHARLGHVPLPGPARRWLAHRLMDVFAQMERECFVLKHISRMDLRGGEVVMVSEPGAS